MNFRLLKIIFICILYTQPLLSQDLASKAIKLFTGSPHTFATITSYVEVAEKTEFLRGSGENVAVLSDWDDTINQTPGAWWQKNHDGSWFCPHTKRFRLEHEVDHTLRHPEAASIIQRIRSRNITFMVTTARPPVIDTVLNTMAQDMNIHPNLMDARQAGNPDLIDYDEIHKGIYKLLSDMEQTELLGLTKVKISTMSQTSGIDLSGQDLALSGHIVVIDDHHVYSYHDGFAFIGHNKGPGMLKLLPTLRLPKGHLVIVDDSARALGSYLDEAIIKSFEDQGYTLHLLHYPVPVA